MFTAHGRALALQHLGLITGVDFVKAADVVTPLQTHQQRVVDRMAEPGRPGLVVAHGVGAGKSLEAIAAQHRLKMPTRAVVPASLQGNYQKELDKHLTPGSDEPEIRTLQGIARRGKDALKVPKGQPGGLLVVDEAHRARDPSSKTYQALRHADADKKMLLTGSPAYNHPVDLSSLVNLAAGESVLPTNKQEFEDRFVQHQKVSPGLWDRLVHGVKPGERASLSHNPELTDALNQWVDYHANPTNTADFPMRRDETVNVPMSGEQKRVYDTLMGNAPAWIRHKVRAGLPPSKAESEDLNAFMTGIRQTMLSPAPFGASADLEHATKQQEAYRRLQASIKENPNHRAVVYSNYLQAGLNPYRQLLEQSHTPYAMFTGDMKQQERQQAVRDYNEGKLRALLVSSAGGEGLDLKGTRQIQLLEPHFNEEKLKQVIGRGIRYQSHADLPEDQRNVAVEHYLSQLPKSVLQRMTGSKRDMSGDQYLQMMSNDKERLNNQLREILQAQTDARTPPEVQTAPEVRLAPAS